MIHLSKVQVREKTDFVAYFKDCICMSICHYILEVDDIISALGSRQRFDEGLLAFKFHALGKVPAYLLIVKNAKCGSLWQPEVDCCLHKRHLQTHAEQLIIAAQSSLRT